MPRPPTFDEIWNHQDRRHSLLLILLTIGPGTTGQWWVPDVV